MAYDEGQLRLVVVGDNGGAGRARTSQQLGAALSVSVWDLTSIMRPVMACLAGKQQVPPDSLPLVPCLLVCSSL